MSLRSILVVQSNPITRSAIAVALQDGGYVIEHAAGGEAAMGAMMRRLPDLVIQDASLPDMDGLQLVARLREIEGATTVPIIAVSGIISPVEEARLFAAGFDDVITKPVDPATLRQRVHAYLPDQNHDADRFGTGRRVIVADDDPVQLKLVQFHLCRFGFEVESVGDGHEALLAARRRFPEALLADVMMPGLDGFGLCHAIRSEMPLAKVPVILMTSGYIEDADRTLAKRVGANSLVLRTPDLKEVIQSLRISLGRRDSPLAPSATALTELERERTRRVIQRLERQVALNAGLAQRCAKLSAELSILNSISDALSQNQGIHATLESVLATCFDAIGLPNGVLYLVGPEGILEARTFGTIWSALPKEGIATFFGHLDLLRGWILENKAHEIPSAAISDAVARDVLAGCGGRAASIVPLSKVGASLGALFLVSERKRKYDDEGAAFIKGVANQISHALSLAATFAERAASEKRAHDQAILLNSVLESIADRVIVLDSRGDALRWNAAADAMVRSLRERSLSLGDWLANCAMSSAGRGPQQPPDIGLSQSLCSAAIDGLEVVTRGDEKRGGQWLSVNTRPLRRENGAITGAVAVFRDITVEKLAQAQLMASDRMASVGMLAAGVAHEINNPLTAVVANLDLALRDLGELLGSARSASEAELRELAEELEDARSASDRVRQIVKDLKMFSRGDDEKLLATDIVEVLESTLQMAWNEIRHRARLVREFTDVPSVKANASRLGQVFLNLLINAAQAIPEGQANRNEIRVTTRVDPDGWVCVEIADTGCGMTEETMARLFTPFFSTKPVGVGTGLGLSICQRIIAGFDGEILVQSRLGKGSVFRVRLPATSETVSKNEPSNKSVAPALRSGKVLVIDDETMIAAVVHRLLRADHEVLTLDNADEALRCFAKGDRFDVILCDLMMPVVTGMDFYAKLMAIAPDQAERIVFLTGGAFTPEARAFLERIPNTQIRIEKPFDVRALQGLINERVR